MECTQTDSSRDIDVYDSLVGHATEMISNL